MTTIQEFLSLVRITFDAATPLQPLALLALLILTLAGFELARRRRGWAIPSQLPLAWLVLLPLSLSAWGAVWFAADEGAPPDRVTWRAIVLTGIGIAQLPLCLWIVYRLRKWPWAAVPAVLASLLWTALAWFVGAMALANDWL